MCDRAHTWVPCQQHAAFSPVKDADTLRSKKWKKNCKVLLIGATAAQVIKMTQDESVAKPAGGGAGSGAGTGPEAHVNWNDQTMYVPLLCLATLLSASLSFSVLLEMSCSKFSIWFLFSFYSLSFSKTSWVYIIWVSIDGRLNCVRNGVALTLTRTRFWWCTHVYYRHKKVIEKGKYLLNRWTAFLYQMYIFLLKTFSRNICVNATLLMLRCWYI